MRALSSCSLYCCIVLLCFSCRSHDGGSWIAAPDAVRPHVEAQVADLLDCLARNGYSAKRPRSIAVQLVPAEGRDGFGPWFTRDGVRVYGLASGSVIQIPHDGAGWSEVALRHEIAHVIATSQGWTEQVHPPQLLPCAPLWYGSTILD